MACATISAVGNVKQLLNADGMQAESHFRLTAVHTFYQFAQAANTANKINTLVRPLVFDAEQRVEQIVL